MHERYGRIRIAFVLTTFVVGGVEKSFLDLIDSIDQNRYDVTVFLPDDRGEWTPLLKERCRIQYLKNETFKEAFGSQLRAGDFYGAFRSLLYRILARVHYKRHYRKSTEYFIRSMPRVKEKFDCAVAYQIINDDCVLSTLFRINAPKKAVWSHAYINNKETIYAKWYNQFDRIFCVSEFARKALTDQFPVLADKTEVLHNTVNNRLVQKLSEGPVCDAFVRAPVTIVTVGRLSKEKGQNLIPRTVRILTDTGNSVKWYLVGEGELRGEIERNIEEEQVQERLILLGSKNNPYPYIKACDIYVQTSLVEGWGLTVSEAKVLKKPIVTTDAGVMSEQIQTGVNGIIVSEWTAEALAAAISQLIDHPELREKFVKQLQREDACYNNELNKLYEVISG